MSQKILFIQAPFTQLNTPYPATAYLSGFCKKQGIQASQADLGIETILEIFSKTGLQILFDSIEEQELSDNAWRIAKLKRQYLKCIDPVLRFLQGDDATLANVICARNYLPEASRFEQLADLEWAFGTMGIQDKARHLSTLFLEDISDLIIEALDPHFGFSRYAERLGMSARSFDDLYHELNAELSFTDQFYLPLLQKKIEATNPNLVAFSVPFPGNLYAAFKGAQYIKKHFPSIKTAMGGGFPNTELRSLKDPRVFQFFDFITLDDGEALILNLVEYLDGKRELSNLKRCFVLQNGQVQYFNQSETPDFKQKDVGTPDYAGLPLDKYLSVIEVANPMHRLWNDGRWNKLTLAHGCYWGKCTFCDISLDYIKVYEATTAKVLVDRMEEMMAQTGETGFHFVDEAAPPALMKELAIEILKRELSVTWWTNIRFEKSFTPDLCRLLAASGCIAISGGLEVASDRLLELIDKGVTVGQVSRVTRDLTESGIMVHAYLMYGYPTQTVQETIDSLEVVRQLYLHGVIQSGFWHQFAMTAHSPVGINPTKFKVKTIGVEQGDFANNDLEFEDITGINHNLFSEGLKTSLFNYMHGICFDFDLQDWFDFEIPKSTIAENYIETLLSAKFESDFQPNRKLIWLGMEPDLMESSKAGFAILIAQGQQGELSIELKKPQAFWLQDQLLELGNHDKKPATLAKLKMSFEEANLGSFEKFWKSNPILSLREFALLAV